MDTPSSSSARRGFKIPVPVFVAATALLAVVAGWFVYDRVFRVKDLDITQYESLITPSSRARSRFVQRTGRPMPANAGLGVLKRRNGFDVRVVGARARFEQDGELLTVSPRLLDVTVFDGRDRSATFTRFVAIRDAKAAAEAKVTPEQIEKLREINVPREMSIPDDARQRLLELGRRYAAASEAEQPAIEQELTQAFRDIAAAALQPTVNAYADSAKQVRDVLSPEQIVALGGTSRR